MTAGRVGRTADLVGKLAAGLVDLVGKSAVPLVGLDMSHLVD